MHRGMLLLLSLSVVSGLSTGALAVSARSWTISSAKEFRQGTLAGTALDGEGRVRLAPTLDRLWGPGEGIVWDVEPAADGDGVFVALSTPTRVLRVATGREPEVWYESGDEGLVAAIASDGNGGLYFGLSPEGRLFHAGASGQYREAVNTGAQFIWALAAAEDGTVWIGTGLPGRLLRYGSDGGLETVFDTADDPVRCILLLAGGEVVFGTGGRGRVIRVDAAGRAFVLFDADETEIVALETDESGSIYALAAQGSKQLAAAKATAGQTVSNTVRVTATAPPERDPDDAAREQRTQEARRSEPPRRFQTAPGGALYRIAKDGDYQKIWTSPKEIPFGLARGAADTMLVATGDSGRVHAIDPRGRSSILLKIPSDQASALTRAADGRIFVGGTTDARVESIGPELRAVGSYLSPAHDVGTIADWGRMSWEADQPPGTEVRAAVRVGNTAEPDPTWSDWVGLGPISGAEMELPAARWFQARVELEASRKGLSPMLRRLEVSFQPHNRRPTITEVVVQPAGVVWTRSVSQSSRQVGPFVTTDPIVRKTVAGLQKTVGTKPVRKTYELGARTVSWKASDPDGDGLTYRLDVRREGSDAWFPLAVGIENNFLGWDARGMPDGLYRVRLVAVDGRDNPEGRQLEDRQISAAFRIDNTRPSIGDPRIRRDGARYDLEFVATDPGGNLAAAEVAVDSGDWQPLDPMDGVADSSEERYLLVIEAVDDDDEVEGHRTVKVRVTDSAGNMGGDAWLLDP